jgi:hypothetical protein
MDVDKVAVLVCRHGHGQVLPPMIQQPFLADKTEPGGKQQRLVFHHGNEAILRHPLGGIHLIRMGTDSEFRLILNAEK